MSGYETNIGKAEKSIFAIGDNARAEGTVGGSDLDDMKEILRELLRAASTYSDPAADEVKDLTLDATLELGAGKPEKETLRRLVEATRKLAERLGPAVIGAGALADAADKITALIRHL